jgi:hypothetical protein
MRFEKLSASMLLVGILRSCLISLQLDLVLILQMILPQFEGMLVRLFVFEVNACVKLILLSITKLFQID